MKNASSRLPMSLGPVIRSQWRHIVADASPPTEAQCGLPDPALLFTDLSNRADPFSIMRTLPRSSGTGAGGDRVRRFIADAEQRVRREIADSLRGHGPWSVRRGKGCLTFAPQGTGLGSAASRRVGRSQAPRPQRLSSQEGRSRLPDSGGGGAGGDSGPDDPGGNGEPDGLWTPIEVMAYLRVSRSWVYQHAEAGTLPVVRMPGSPLLRFKPEMIRAYARGEWSPPKVTPLRP
ncbi:MAG TPA: helix-turn-helix domain-containing protein [Polyangia bacterium]|jgi:hypothetical protein|nr:helix-turn-helix domain-containing protein [Polyangia bacterium]